MTNSHSNRYIQPVNCDFLKTISVDVTNMKPHQRSHLRGINITLSTGCETKSQCWTLYNLNIIHIRVFQLSVAGACNGQAVLRTTTGMVKVDNRTYTNDMSCQWLIQVETGKVRLRLVDILRPMLFICGRLYM